VISGADLPSLAWLTGGRPFSLARLLPIRHRGEFIIKPFGGLWTSPRTATGTAWTDWCRSAEYGDPDKPLVPILPDPDCAVFCIDCLADLKHLGAQYPLPVTAPAIDVPMWPRIDWEKVATDVDAVWLTAAGEHQTRYSTPGLYGWDCATVLWLQPRFTAGRPT
jgi:hypothetical protein